MARQQSGPLRRGWTAEKTVNAWLGIVGGLSILGTTGIVVPYSCSSWIHSIRRGIDVACAAGAAEILALAGSRGGALARLVAAGAREVALATLSGKTAVEVAIVDREGGLLARLGG